MASPKVLIQIFLTSTRIVGKAFLEAGRQAVKNAKTAPQAGMGSDVAGVGNARSGSLTDQLTRQHRMTLDEAHLILNTKSESTLENVLQHYEHLLKANSPPPPLPKGTTGKAPPPKPHSHYIQSKVVRARERIEAELKGPDSPNNSPHQTQTPPPPPPSGSDAT
ncbi:hypothetical protein BDZ89DRAFT_1056934 [Hymenopellis radicata]|nr:hypothetical protein BDZ89DRAFT_1056934 [Hymenopellis radicata]